MLNSLDLLVIVFMAMAALSLLSVLLMFLIKNKIVRSISLYVAAAMGIYSAVVGIVFFGPYFLAQAVIAILVGAASIAAVVLNVLGLKRKNDKLDLIARITATAALIIGIVNIFFI